MNILIAVTILSKSNGGVCTHVIDLCRELLKRNHNVCLLTDNNDNDYLSHINEIKEANYSGEFTFYPMPLHDIPLKSYFKTSSSIRKIVKEHSIDIIHVHGQALCILAELVKIKTFGRVPFVWTNHIDAIHRPEQFKKILKMFKFPIISVSTDLKELMVNEYGVADKRVYVVCNGTNVEKYIPFSEEERKKLRALKQWDDKYVIALLARMSDVKGHRYLLEAVNNLQRNNNIDDIKVVFAGQLYDDYKGYLLGLEKYAAENNIDLEFLGFQDPRYVFGVADLSVLPSVFEGFALTVLESVSMHCPSIRSDSPGHTDTIEFSLVAPKKDVEKLTELILYAYTHRDEMNEMAKKGREIITERFSVEKQIDNTLYVYKSIIG